MFMRYSVGTENREMKPALWLVVFLAPCVALAAAPLWLQIVGGGALLLVAPWWLHKLERLGFGKPFRE